MDTQLHLTVNKQKDILIADYIRFNYKGDISADVHALILLFYDEVNSFNIDNKTLQKFLDGKNIFGKQFAVGPLTFRCALYPKKDDQFSLQLLLEPNVQSVVAYFFMYNIQADQYWKGTRQFDQADIVSGSYVNPNDNEDTVWVMEEGLPLIDYSEHNTLDLSIWTQILSIRYNDDKTEDYNLDIRMKKEVMYTWHIEGEELKQFVDCERFKSISSENFPVDEKYRNWVLSVVPNGYHNGSTFVYCELVRMPNKIKKFFEVVWSLEVKGIETKIYSGSKKFGAGEIWYIFVPVDQKVLNNKFFKEAESVTFIMNIKITKVWHSVHTYSTKKDDSNWFEQGIH